MPMIAEPLVTQTPYGFLVVSAPDDWANVGVTGDTAAAASAKWRERRAFWETLRERQDEA